MEHALSSAPPLPLCSGIWHSRCSSFFYIFHSCRSLLIRHLPSPHRHPLRFSSTRVLSSFARHPHLLHSAPRSPHPTRGHPSFHHMVIQPVSDHLSQPAALYSSMVLASLHRRMPFMMNLASNTNFRSSVEDATVLVLQPNRTLFPRSVIFATDANGFLTSLARNLEVTNVGNPDSFFETWRTGRCFEWKEGGNKSTCFSCPDLSARFFLRSEPS